MSFQVPHDVTAGNLIVLLCRDNIECPAGFTRVDANCVYKLADGSEGGQHYPLPGVVARGVEADGLASEYHGTLPGGSPFHVDRRRRAQLGNR